jgi:hypothetical protein
VIFPRGRSMAAISGDPSMIQLEEILWAFEVYDTEDIKYK